LNTTNSRGYYSFIEHYKERGIARSLLNNTNSRGSREIIIEKRQSATLKPAGLFFFRMF